MGIARHWGYDNEHAVVGLTLHYLIIYLGSQMCNRQLYISKGYKAMAAEEAAPTHAPAREREL